MSLYLDPTEGHVLLSTEAAALDPDALDAHALIAERVLGLTGTSLTGDADVADAARAVALQVNYQVALPPDVWAMKKWDRGQRSVEYRNALPAADPRAEAIVDGLFPDEDPTEGWNLTGPRR